MTDPSVVCVTPVAMAVRLGMQTLAVPNSFVKRIPFLRGAAEVIQSHHERYEGGGYPQGLRGEEIPLAARIFCAVDADSILQPDSLRRAVRPFLEEPNTVATGGTVRIANGCVVRGGFLEKVALPSNFLAGVQVSEYLRAFL